jgi:hypothetical protein
MSYTKRQFVEAALEEIGLADYVFDLSPEQLQSAVRRMDAMMAAWNAAGIRLGYPLTSNPDNTDLDTVTAVPDSANEAIILNLALRLSPSYGKAIALTTSAMARLAYNTLLSRAAMPAEQQFPQTLPVGAGQKSWNIDFPFFQPPTEPLLAGEDGEIVFE